MNFFINCIAALLTGIAASMGLGGGMILIVFLTVFLNTPQINAQGINLVFFIPIAIVSLIFHSKNKLINWKEIIPAVIIGALGAVIGTFVAQYIGSPILSKIFAVFLLIVGVKELFSKKQESHK